MTEEEFQKTIAEFLLKEPDGDVLLARRCEVAVSTVSRWARGASCPAPRMREWVVSWTK